MQPVSLVWSCAAVAGVSLALTWLARRYALRASLMDVPNLRSSHVQPTPRGGGVAIVGSFLAALAVTYPIGGAPVDVLLVLIGGGGLIALTGFVDDHISMSAVSRLFIQFLAAAIAVFVVGGYFQAPAPVEFIDVLKGGLTAVGLVWLTNLYNFMDGIDGLAGVETVTVCGGAALFLAILGGQELVPACLFLAAAAAGFLAWNWPPARIFMGDVGSAFIGFSIGVLGLAASRSTEIPLWTWAILLGIFLVDATVTLLWRMGSGQRWYAAHRQRPPAAMRPERIEVPSAVADFPRETVRVPRSAVERKLDLRQWTEMEHGGHFAAMEQPEALVADVRRFFRGIRGG